MITGQLALIFATAFAGASTYINAVEQPARLLLQPQELLLQWKTSYHRGTIMQVSLAVLSTCFGAICFNATQNWRWLAGTLALLALLPYTFIAVMPTNRKLLSFFTAAQDEPVRSNVRRWSRLHAGRTALGITAVALFFWALL